MSIDFDELFDDLLDETRPVVANTTYWSPHPDNEPQQLAYEMADVVDEIGYGGQAGGGKTDLGLGLACTKFHNTLILRRKYRQMGGIIDRGNEIYPVDFVAGDKKQWRWENTKIVLGYVDRPGDWKNYQGQGRDFIMFEEAAELLEKPVRAITGWVRTKGEGNTLVLYTFNPPTTPEGDWIIQYFKPWLDPSHANPAEDGEIRWFGYTKDGDQLELENGDSFELEGETIYPISRTFISASRHSNPYLGNDYEARLSSLPEPLRTMVRTGAMDLNAPDDDWQLIPKTWILNAQERWKKRSKPDMEMTGIGVDVARGGSDKTVICRLYGSYFDNLVAIPGAQSPDGAVVRDQVLKYYEDGVHAVIDVVGIGSSAYDHLKVVKGVKITPLNGASKSKRKDRSGQYGFSNMRAQIYWQFREALDPETGDDIALPDSRELYAELAAARYSVSGDAYKVESKEHIKNRLGRSPDLADAIVYAWHASQNGPKHRRVEFW